MSKVSLKNINKIYSNGFQAVYNFNLEIEDKEFIVLVGPSGCGKSTTLRMIAGLEEISSGQLYIDGKLMNEIPAKNRSIAMVFQSYALYPHMTVFDNMAFGLKLRKMPKIEIKERIESVAKTLGLSAYLDRKPKALSGGQRQRVALGRAIVRDSQVFLFDEPLSNLDAKLRGQMRTEITKIHKNIGATSIYVTHDQVEAMTMASKIVVMKDGYIQQIGAPKDVYNLPANVFVAGFLGAPSMNFLPGRIDDNGNFVSFKKTISFPLSKEQQRKIKEQNNYGKSVLLGIRPEDILLVNETKKTSIEIEVDFLEMLGHETNLHFLLEDTHMISIINSRLFLEENSKVKILFDVQHCHLFDQETQQRIC